MIWFSFPILGHNFSLPAYLPICLQYLPNCLTTFKRVKAKRCNTRPPNFNKVKNLQVGCAFSGSSRLHLVAVLFYLHIFFCMWQSHTSVGKTRRARILNNPKEWRNNHWGGAEIIIVIPKGCLFHWRIHSNACLSCLDNGQSLNLFCTHKSMQFVGWSFVARCLTKFHLFTGILLQ